MWVESIQSYDSNGVISTISAEDLNYSNATLVTEKGDASFTININGTMESNGGEFSEHKSIVIHHVVLKIVALVGALRSMLLLNLLLT